jgi:branched-subunit amino acid ABC-type transport system permease component
MSLFLQLIVSGLTSGAIYALLAIGMVLTFRTSRVPNLAHGETFAVAGLVTAALYSAGVSLWLAISAGLIAGIVVSVVVEVVILAPRPSWSVDALLLATLGFAFLSRGILLLIFGADPLAFPSLFSGSPIRIAGAVIPLQSAALIVCSIIACVGVTLLLVRTSLGLRLRASAANADVAQLMGVNVRSTRLVAFVLAGVLGALAAILLVPLTSVDFHSGLSMTLRGFIAAAFAGMSETRAIFAGFVLGLFEAIVAGYIGALFQDPIVFAGLIALVIYQSRKIRYGGAVRA